LFCFTLTLKTSFSQEVKDKKKTEKKKIIVHRDCDVT